MAHTSEIDTLPRGLHTASTASIRTWSSSRRSPPPPQQTRPFGTARWVPAGIISAGRRDFRFQHSAQWDSGANPAEWVPAHPTPEHQCGRKQREFRLAGGRDKLHHRSDEQHRLFFSELFLKLLSKTQDFYDGLSPMINRTFTASQTSFKNAFTIFDLLSVASIHNSTDDSLRPTSSPSRSSSNSARWPTRTSSTWPTTSPSPSAP